MPRNFDQLKRMREKAERLKARARQAEDPGTADIYLRQAENVLASIQVIKDNWEQFGERARGNTNFKGRRHSRETRKKMSAARKEFWASKKGFEKMWRARVKRQYREEGTCPIRFPRLPASVDRAWLKTYRDRYKRIIGERPKMRLY